MEESTDFLALSLLAAVSVTVGLTSAGFTGHPAAPQCGTRCDLASTVAGILGLDREQVVDYIQGRRTEVCYGTARLHSEQA